MYGESNMETYITICKIDSQWEFAVWLRKHKQGLCINLEGWDGEGDGRGFKREGTYVYLWLIHVDVWQKPTQHSKAIILKLKIYIYFKSLQITNAGEGMERREPSYTVGGNVSCYSHYGKQYGSSSED